MAKQSEATLLLRIKTMGEEALKSVEESFDTLKNAATYAFAAISAVIVKSIADYREQEIATQALTQAMVNNGIYSKALKDDYLAQASAIQKLTLFGDEQVIGAQAAVQMAIGEEKVTRELTMAIADLAQAKGMDLVSAAELVGKTLSSNNNLLARQGIEFDNNTRGAERLSAVTQALNGKFGGQAEAATGGYGAIKQLNNAVSDLFETLGEKLLPLFGFAARSMKEFAEDTRNTSPVMDTFVDTLKYAAITARFLFTTLEVGMALIMGPLSTAFAAMGQAFRGEFAQMAETIKGFYSNWNAEVKTIVENGVKTIQDIYNADEEANKARLLREEATLKQSLLNKSAAKQLATEEDMAKELENNQRRLDMQAAQNELERAQKSGNDAAILSAQIAQQDAILKSTTDHKAKLAAQNEKARLQEKQRDDLAAQAKLAALKDTFSTIATMSGSSNQTLAAIGKAAALTQIAIDTPAAISKALASAPPPFNFALAAGVGAAMASQAARVSGIQLAEGGIVKARPGGIQATIGEGGKDEAVIPLENGQIPGSSGGGHTFIFQGPVMGDERQAYEFAVMVDRKLLDVRRNGDSVAFERIT